jgi:glycosyltransferase involved in cell wall biosynthesis
MKILFLIRSLNYGGTESQLAVLAKGLREGGYSALVATFYAGGPLEAVMHKNNAPVVCLQKCSRWDVVGFLWKLISLLRCEKPDILHGYLPVPNLLTVLLKPLFPKVRMVWGVRASNVDLSQYDWLARVVFRMECFFSHFADLIIVNSNAGRDYHLKHGFPEKKMVVIPNGIDTEYFKPDAAARAQKRAEWRIGQDEKLIGIVARLDPMKDHPTFLKAAALLAKEREDVRFVCVGDGLERYKSKMKELSSELGLVGKIIWAGAHKDMNAVYNAMDVHVSSSYGEGFPNVIGEAMACGVQCVVTDVGDSALIVGRTGVIAQPKSPEALKACIAFTLEKMEGHEWGKEICRRRIVENFSIHALATKTDETLSNLLLEGKN